MSGRAPSIARMVAGRYLTKRSAYSETTLDQVMAGMGMLLAQSVVVSDQFFDEREIKKYLLLRRQYHETFAEACEDLAEEIAAGSFGESAKVAIGSLERIGAIPSQQAQRALVQASKTIRALKRLDLSGDVRLRRIIFLASQLAARGVEHNYEASTMTAFIKEMLKNAAVPSQVKTFLRKAIKHMGSANGRFNETANPGAWFEMPEDRKEKIHDTLMEALKERDAIFEKFKDDPERRQAEWVKNQQRIERLKNVAGVNLKIIERAEEAGDGPSLDAALKKESKLQADGPTEFVQEQIERYFKDAYAKKGTLPREYGKILTQIKKARTLDTVHGILTEAKNKRLMFDDTVEQLEGIWAKVGKNLAVKRGLKLVPLQWEPISAEDFQKKHSTGRVVLDSSMDEKTEMETLGRVSRAVEDLEGIFGKGFCGKHDKPLEFNFEGSTGMASASYFAYENPGNWQPRVKFGEDYAGLLAHELSHYFDDLLATKISQVQHPEHTQKYRNMSRDLFGSTGVDLEYWVGSGANASVSKVIPELGKFAEAVVATPDFQRWKDMTGSAHEQGLQRAIKALTGQEYHELPKDHPYKVLYYDMPQFKSEWPPELLEATEKVYADVMQGDKRKLTYFNSGIEVWARMVEQYVATKLADAGIANPWLTQLTYDIDVLPQMMDQETFEAKIVPLLDKVFATIKERSLVAHRVVQRYLEPS